MIIGSKLFFFKDLTSTNVMASALLKDKNIPEGSVIHASFQSSGKGQMGNKWESEDGKNLLMSIVLFPSMLVPAEQFYISMTISLGICDFLKRYIPVCKIKWPNDIYVNNDKIAGILIENSILGDTIEHSVAGIGLNINQKKFLSNAPNPISLSMITGKDFDIGTCLTQLISDLDKRYKQLISGEYGKIKEDYVSQLFRFNKWFNYRDLNSSYVGRIISITDFGRLKIEQKNGKTHEYNFKEVEFIL